MTKGYRFTKSLNEVARGLFDGFATKSGLTDSRIITNWKDIVGAELSDRCYPYLLKNNILFIVTNDASLRALFSYYRETIVNKINFYFGVNFITDVKLKRYE